MRTYKIYLEEIIGITFPSVYLGYVEVEGEHTLEAIVKARHLAVDAGFKLEQVGVTGIELIIGGLNDAT